MAFAVKAMEKDFDSQPEKKRIKKSCEGIKYTPIPSLKLQWTELLEIIIVSQQGKQFKAKYLRPTLQVVEASFHQPLFRIREAWDDEEIVGEVRPTIIKGGFAML